MASLSWNVTAPGTIRVFSWYSGGFVRPAETARSYITNPLQTRQQFTAFIVGFVPHSQVAVVRDPRAMGRIFFYSNVKVTKLTISYRYRKVI